MIKDIKNKEVFQELITDYLENLDLGYDNFNPIMLPAILKLEDEDGNIYEVNKPQTIRFEEDDDVASHDAWREYWASSEMLFTDLGFRVNVYSTYESMPVGGDFERGVLDVTVIEDAEVSDTDIKKYLLKQKPIAKFDFIRKGNAYYSVKTTTGSGDLPTGKITFEIPVEDMGEADFTRNMEGNLLMRWIYSYTKIN
jgi:hypothetical protein